MAKATATTQWNLAPGWTVGAEFGVVRGNSTLRARLTQIWLGIDLEPGQDGRLAPAASVVRTEWIGALQHHTNRRPPQHRTCRFVEPRDVTTIDDHLAAARVQETTQDTQQGGFSAPRRALHADPLTRRDGDACAAQCDCFRLDATINVEQAGAPQRDVITHGGNICTRR